MAYDGFDFTDDEEFRKRVPGGGINGAQPVQIQPDPQAFTQQTGRESFHYDRIPDAYRNIPGFSDAANNPNIDPGKFAQDYLSSQRAAGRTDESDAAALTGAGYMGGRPPAATAPTTQRVNVPPLIGTQFDDPYTKQLEAITSAQMGEVRSNPGLDQLKQFLQQRFQVESQSPGFSPDEMAVLHTQALEPIEALRDASKKRAVERASARGMLPSSGLHELDMRDIDIAADKSRAAAGRDLAINAIDRRDADLARATGIAQQLGLTIPTQQRGEELSLASLLYDLPRKALQDALAVTQGSPTSNDLFAQSVRLAQQNQQNAAMNQQKWAQIASMLPYLDF